ncbi:MAG TPA: hypothetical protein VHB79_06410 [Polyangiaceae bacterium]|nr:hypothetical protein [Polyangiaceae bacterium]
MAHSKKESGFWASLVEETQLGEESHAAIAAKHGVMEAALKYNFYKVECAAGTDLTVRIETDARLLSVEMEDTTRSARRVARRQTGLHP